MKICNQNINHNNDLSNSIESLSFHSLILLNAKFNTNFIYEIENFKPSSAQIKNINTFDSKRKIKDRIEAISLVGGNLIFHETENKIFSNNLVLIDSFLPTILGSIIKYFFTTNLRTISDLTTELQKHNPTNFKSIRGQNFYCYKVKQLLVHAALGMCPSEVWNGIYPAKTGPLNRKINKNVLRYFHTYNINQFEDYLFANTRLETASSSKHKFGKIYEKDGKHFIKLNLQIRFFNPIKITQKFNQLLTHDRTLNTP